MTVQQYIDGFESTFRHYIGIPARSSISGAGYDIGRMDDGTVLRVGTAIYSTNRAGPNTSEILARVGRLLANLTPETRAAQLAEMGQPDARGFYDIAGTRWTAAGEFVGLV